MPDPTIASPGGQLPQDAGRFTTAASMHTHRVGQTADSCDICSNALVHEHAFNADGCVCSHEPWQHSFRGCVVGPSEASRCPCPASYSCDR